MTLEELKQKNKPFQFSQQKPKPTEYIVSYSAVYQRPGQQKLIVEDTAVCEIDLPADAKAKDLLTAIKKSLLKEKFKDSRLENMKKLIVFNLYKF